jgi:hypothetical protein
LNKKSGFKGLEITLLAISLSVLALFSFMVWYANHTNLWPSESWGLTDGNHGPWHGFLLGILGDGKAPLRVLKNALFGVLFLQTIAISLTCLCQPLGRWSKRSFLIILNTIFFFILMGRYAWLVD